MFEIGIVYSAKPLFAFRVPLDRVRRDCFERVRIRRAVALFSLFRFRKLDKEILYIRFDVLEPLVRRVTQCEHCARIALFAPERKRRKLGNAARRDGARLSDKFRYFRDPSVRLSVGIVFGFDSFKLFFDFIEPSDKRRAPAVRYCVKLFYPVRVRCGGSEIFIGLWNGQRKLHYVEHRFRRARVVAPVRPNFSVR